MHLLLNSLQRYCLQIGQRTMPITSPLVLFYSLSNRSTLKPLPPHYLKEIHRSRIDTSVTKIPVPIKAPKRFDDTAFGNWKQRINSIRGVRSRRMRCITPLPFTNSMKQDEHKQLNQFYLFACAQIGHLN